MTPMNLATAEEFHAEIARLQAENDRLRVELESAVSLAEGVRAELYALHRRLKADSIVRIGATPGPA